MSAVLLIEERPHTQSACTVARGTRVFVYALKPGIVLRRWYLYSNEVQSGLLQLRLG